MEQREMAEGCGFCHTNQNTCNSCHTRHEFSVVEARKPKLAMCHNGVNHNELENYMLSKHGTIFQMRGNNWDWNARLADAMEKGGINAPTGSFAIWNTTASSSVRGLKIARRPGWGLVPIATLMASAAPTWDSSTRAPSTEPRSPRMQSRCLSNFTPIVCSRAKGKTVRRLLRPKRRTGLAI